MAVPRAACQQEPPPQPNHCSSVPPMKKISGATIDENILPVPFMRHMSLLYQVQQIEPLYSTFICEIWNERTGNRILRSCSFSLLNLLHSLNEKKKTKQKTYKIVYVACGDRGVESTTRFILLCY